MQLELELPRMAESPHNNGNVNCRGCHYVNKSDQYCPSPATDGARLTCVTEAEKTGVNMIYVKDGAE